ncbi:hypothetical protein [Actinoplanes sp. GCM10030250]|uniref:hypothetical protein n=1 Tax=Actinoplanes sp. GCM10030250 TaxID=3273376 RepID=UPI00361BD24A
MSPANELRWTPDLGSREADRQRVEDVAFTPMPVRLRNELISRAYGDFAAAMADLLGTGDATWATFGQWASHTIGGYLTVRIPVLGSIIGRAFADGNRDVFADIGRAHAVFLDTVGAAARSGGDVEAAWQECERDLRRRLFAPPGAPGGGSEDEFWVSLSDPRLRPGGPRHNELLVLGFRAYRHAVEEADGERRSGQILLGNCLLALHEQRLLSLAIAMGFRSWVRTLTTPWLTLQTRYGWRHRDPGATRLWLEDRCINLITRWFAAVELPTGTVRTGCPVPGGDRPVPVVRVPVRDPGSPRRKPADLPDEVLLGKLFSRFDVDGRPSRCWADLDDRMPFIMALFAEHQRAAWWYDAGRLVRPPAWPELDGALAEQVNLINRPVPGAPEPGEVTCHLTDAQLDELRTRPTHLSIDDVDDLSLETVADDRNARPVRQLSQDVAARLAAVAVDGGLLDPETCRIARNSFTRWTTLWFLGLVFRSLPDSYAAARGAHVIGRVSDLATHPFRRAGETAYFVIDLLHSSAGWTGGVMTADGAAFRSVRGVRVMHGLMAHQLLKRGWNSGAFGVPFNQEDVIGAALSFGVSPIEMLESLGIEPPPQVKDAVAGFWLGIGHLLGAPHDALTLPGPGGRRRPLDYAEARALALAIRRRQHARSLDGVRLSEALQDGVADGFPRWFGWLAPGLTRSLGDPGVTALLLVGSGPEHRPAALVTAVFSALLRLRPARPLARLLISTIGRFWVRPFLAQGRTRPYRRPRQADDVTRLAAEEQVPDHWPAGCSRRPAQPARPE